MWVPCCSVLLVFLCSWTVFLYNMVLWVSAVQALSAYCRRHDTPEPSGTDPREERDSGLLKRPAHCRCRGIVPARQKPSEQLQLQAYFLKNPGNFGPLFLKTLHCAAPLSGMNQHYYHMERGPRRLFFRKNVGVTKSPFPPGNVTFFRRKNADFTARAVRFLEKNGGLVV